MISIHRAGAPTGRLRGFGTKGAQSTEQRLPNRCSRMAMAAEEPV